MKNKSSYINGFINSFNMNWENRLSKFQFHKKEKILFGEGYTNLFYIWGINNVEHVTLWTETLSLYFWSLFMFYWRSCHEWRSIGVYKKVQRQEETQEIPLFYIDLSHSHRSPKPSVNSLGFKVRKLYKYRSTDKSIRRTMKSVVCSRC